MKAPFPHYLVAPHRVKGDVLRIVNDKPIAPGDKLYYGVNKEGIELACNVDEVLLVREAKGDWSDWGIQPYYIEVRVKNIKPY